ncbi:pyridoxal phosphate-dependent aminotransferase [Oceanicella actignis]|uniref:Histidinol-phosphate aminotransferase n=1 Tax=Oceanicella actignis TaxID=1189325 RepID=A0A1M7THM9_9RHOB|nr:pyridoxal phosphate-dependent aminotransferase [Oceanicella actignis]SET58847.1 histidinol-phosphate aminotransferase [Oceanicella actignis]SHN70181.1 histidinol-phosphate aminotransferase [Oceanicella actignis]
MSDRDAEPARPPRLTALARSLPASVPFVGPEAQERALGRAFRARLGANENVFGPSPRAQEATRAAAAEAWMYGDPEAHELRAAIAAHHGARPENVMVGAGIDGILGDLCRLIVAPGTPVVSSDGAYPTFAYHVAGFGGRLVAVPYAADDREDPEALARAARECGAPLVYLANPDNPMGSWNGAEAVRAMLDALPPDCLLCLDEAYAEFAPEGVAPELPADDPRVIRMRTFSKAHGLAGLRVGYALGAPELISAFDKVRNHFGVGRLAQAAALAALGDRAWLDHVRAEVARARARIARIAQEAGLRALPSATNFVAVDCGRDGAFARRVVQALAARGVFVRMPFRAPQDRCIRISAGRPEDLDLLAEVLPAALTEARAG